jgi:hypothetical protein
LTPIINNDIIKSQKRKTKTKEKRRKEMRFIGYEVNGKRFGCGQRKEAYEYAKKIGAEVKCYGYKI